MRFVDNIDQNVSVDFLPRRYFTPFMQVLPFYIVSLVLVLGTLYFREWFSVTETSIIAFLLISLISAVVFFRLQQSNDLVMASDFQNMLFAGVASLGSHFCFFVRQNGTIVYANDGTHQVFPKFGYSQSQAIDDLLSEGKVRQEDARKLYSALTRGKKEKLIFTIHSGNHGPQDFILMIEPLKRPAGYFAVHGRPFMRVREGTEKRPAALAHLSSERIEALLEMLPLGVYFTNETGIIEYANPTLERLAQYEPRGIVAAAMPLQSLIYHADGYETGEFEAVEYTGNVLLSCRNRSLSQAFLHQHRIIAPGGREVGFLGIVTPLS